MFIKETVVCGSRSVLLDLGSGLAPYLKGGLTATKKSYTSLKIPIYLMNFAFLYPVQSNVVGISKCGSSIHNTENLPSFIITVDLTFTLSSFGMYQICQLCF